ncbi:sensor histidine kinase [Fundicoccus culcitae]|uniref:histidine kinase n=1 Tax=Fundicoccus culcitae TaxID=2969821 RepID=A0ABY5P513_9LACT|nr:sensor histidine kinase [Fundicoccus culcitae]UUX33784.1 sensor histidine kinase [Fundicoccus culcitae]
MIRSFLRQEGAVILTFIFTLLIIWGIFALFSLPMDVFAVLFWLLIIVDGLYLLYKAIIFKQQQSLTQQLEEMQEQLQEIKTKNQAKQSEIEEYFLMWVHQIKTPITAAQLILKNPDNRSHTQLKSELLAIENYTNMALNYLKLTNPSTDMVVSKHQIDAMIAPLIRKYSIEFIEHKITLHYQPIEDYVITEANLSSVMIEQILNNALKYAKQKAIWIQFDSQTYQLTITDNGKGIRPEDLPKIFDKGYAGFNGLLNEKSSGLGLYLVQLIANRLDQATTVHSELGEGTTFTIQFHP